MNKKRAFGQRGSAIITASVIAAIAMGTATYLFKDVSFLRKQVISETKKIKIRPIQERLSRLGGFLIASNLIICRQNPWTDGTPGMSCQWNKKNYAGSSKEYGPSEFHLINRGIDSKGQLVMEVDIFKLFPEERPKGLLTGSNVTLKFALKKGDEINAELGNMDANTQSNNKDEFYVVLSGNLEYRESDGKAKWDDFSTVFRRPIAVPKVEVTSTSCAQRCDVSLTEHPHPACRSTFYIDEQTMTDVAATTTNLGPGVIYDLAYERTTAYNDGASLQENTEGKQKVSVNIGDYLVPGGSKNWADSFPCATLTQNQNVAQVVKNVPRFDVDEFLISIFKPQEAHAQFLGRRRNRGNSTPDVNPPQNIATPTPRGSNWQAVYQGSVTTTTLSQHSNPAGTVMYQVNPQAQSYIEPYRMTAPLNEAPKQFSGLMNTTTTTNFFTWVYVDPPH